MKVNALVEIMVEKDMPGSVMAWIFDNYGSDDLDKVKQIAEDLQWSEAGDMSDEEEVGYYVVDSAGSPSELGKETLEMYFNYDSFGHDLILNGEYTVVGSHSKGRYIIAAQSV